MKTIAAISLFIFLICLALMGIQIGQEVMGHYRWEKGYSQEWHLADKSSTLTAKQEHIQKFVDLLEQGYAQGHFASYDAIWLITPNNSFENNLSALKTLNLRLGEIQSMDPTSFQYNTAIQQITAQEQGEASAMMGVFSGCFYLANYPWAWHWIELTVMLIWIIIGGLAGIMFFAAITD